MKKLSYVICLVIFQFINNLIIASGEIQNKISGYVITNVSIVDVENNCILKNKTIIVRDGLIYKINSNRKINEPDGLKIIDGTNLFVIPGLFDSHVHYLDQQTFGSMFISHGVLFVREMGNTTQNAIAQRDLLNKGALSGPEMITTGSILDGYPPIIPEISLACTTGIGGREMVRKQLTAGVNQIKAYSRLEKDVFFSIIDECRGNNIKAVGHVPEGVLLEDAAKAGLSCSEHFFGFGNVIAVTLNESPRLQTGGMGNDQDFFLRYPEINREALRERLKKIRGYGLAVCPTLIVTKCMISLEEIYNRNYPMMNYISPFLWDVWKMWEPQKRNIPFFKEIYPYHKIFLKDLYDAGFTLLVGTDLSVAGIVPGYSVHEEMLIWQEAGIPPIDILRSATIIPAKFMGVDKSLGSIEVGKKASFILSRDNPLADIRNAMKIDGVFLHGVFFNREAIDSLKSDIIIVNETISKR